MKEDRNLGKPEEFMVNGKKLNFEEVVERVFKINKKEIDGDFKKDKKPVHPPKPIKTQNRRF